MIRQAATTQARVVGALILREMRVRYGHSQLGYIWAIAEPLVWVLAISAMFSVTGAHPPHGDSMALFVSLGILPYFLFRNMSNQLGHAFKANEALLNFPIVKEIDTILARAALEVATVLVILSLLLSGHVMLGNAPWPADILGMLTALFALGLLGFGVGTINAVLGSKISSWMNVFGMLTTPLFWTSGIFFSLESLPANISAILQWNPILHGIEAMRDGFFHNYRSAAIDLPYLFWFGAILTLIGLAAERAIRIRRP